MVQVTVAKKVNQRCSLLHDAFQATEAPRFLRRRLPGFLLFLLGTRNVLRTACDRVLALKINSAQ